MDKTANQEPERFKRENRNYSLSNSPQQAGQKKVKEEKTSFFDFIKIIFWALVIIVPIRTFLFPPFFVQGASMEPNFHDGEYLIVNELGYKETKIGIGGKIITVAKPYKELQRGDVVVFRFPLNPREFFIKRVIGLPGEKIELKEGQVIVYNRSQPEGAILDESRYLPNNFSSTKCGSGQCVFELGEKEYLVLGDNRSHSSDSRSWGVLPEKFVIGKVSLRAWPFNRFQVF